MAGDYTYLVARLHALEAAMPDRGWFQRLARTPEEQLLGALREYYRGFETVTSPFEFETGIEAEKSAVMELITRMIGDRRTRIFLRGGYDFDNVIHMWKAHRLGAAPALNPFGLVEPEVIERAVTGGDRMALPDYLRDLIASLEAAGDSDELVDAEYAGESAKWNFLAAMAPGKEELSFIRGKIDLINITTFLRLKRTSLRKRSLDAAWIGGGEIETGRLRSLFRESEEELFKFLATTRYRGVVRLGLGKETPLGSVDPILRIQLLDLLDGSRYRFFDLSPVIYHLELRERELQLLRMIMVGKLNRLPEERILDGIDSLLPS